MEPAQPRATRGTLSQQFAQIFRLLRRTEPIEGAYDVEWWGPYFIPRPGHWHPSRFLLYGGKIYGTLLIERAEFSLCWDTKSGDITFTAATHYRSAPPCDDATLWERAVPQLATRLHAALRGPEIYNRRVRRCVPLEARTGRVERRWTWRRGARAPLSLQGLHRFEHACRLGARVPSRAAMTAAAYLRAAALAYDAVFPELGALRPERKYKSRADGRDGGLLAIPRRDAKAFHDWYTSRAWTGTHPWEIVFGHPHGIMLSPTLDSEDRWRLFLSVDSPCWYRAAVSMAIAIAKVGTPFEFANKEAVVSALRGVDLVEVGPHGGQVSLASLREVRRDAPARVLWDPIPEIRPISGRQRQRVLHVLRAGSPHGWPGNGMESPAPDPDATMDPATQSGRLRTRGARRSRG